MRIITKLRERKPSEPTTLIQLRDEDKRKLSAMVLDIVKQQLEAKGLTPITITVDLTVDMQVLLPTTTATDKQTSPEAIQAPSDRPMMLETILAAVERLDARLDRIEDQSNA